MRCRWIRVEAIVAGERVRLTCARMWGSWCKTAGLQCIVLVCDEKEVRLGERKTNIGVVLCGFVHRIH